MKRRNFRVRFDCVLFSVVLVAGCLGRVGLAGVPWEEVGKLVAGDGSRSDLFGCSTAMSGDIALIGASNDENNGLSSGSAYIFDVVTGEQLFKLLPQDAVNYQDFGISVSIDGNLAIVGAANGDNNGLRTGSAYIFDVSTGKQLFKLTASDGASDDLFGLSVAISGNLAVVGAYGDDDMGDKSGSAYVFDVTTGQQLFKLLASDGAPDDFFGWSVTLSGNLAMIGAYGDDDRGIESGSAYIFDATTGLELSKLVATDGAEGDRFGEAVAMTGNIALIGSNRGEGRVPQSGAAYIFDALTGEQIFKLIASDGASGDDFGFDVAVNENYAVVGAYWDDDNGVDSGSAYVFDVETGHEISRFLASDGDKYENFGGAVAISGSRVLIGALFDNNENGTTAGSAYLFEPRMTNYLSVEPFPLVGGEDVVFSFVGGIPDVMSWFLYSVDGLGETIIKPLNVTVDLVNPRVAIGPGLTDGDGNREVIRMLPSVTEAVDVWFQVVQRENVTNVVATEILP